MNSTVVPSWGAHGGGQALHLRSGGGPRRHRLAVAVVVRVHLGGGEAQCTLLEGGVKGGFHGVEVAGRGLAANGPLPHDQAAQGRVADQEAGVDGDAAVEVAQPLAERPPVPGQAGSQRRQGHALDPRHHARDVVGVLGGERGQREAAVPAEHRGDAVQR